RRFLNAPSVNDIVFTKNTTEAINTVAYGWGMPKIGEGDEIVLTIMEHHSNIVPWHFIRERQGAMLVWVPVDDEGAFHIEDFEKSLTERTKLVAITHMSNALGTIVPVKEVCRIAHERGIPVLIDGYVATAAAAILKAANPSALDHCLIGHVSGEPGHLRAIEMLGKTPLLALGMRLGEGTGAALAAGIVKAAAACHSGMATFAQAGVSNKH
ncbi:aminotransferase class V-fold PLP-dependent enzyme, partial [Rhizobium ruizarguesonis]